MQSKESHHFTVRYDGPVLKDGAIDVRDLAPALLGLSELFDEANRLLNDGRCRVSVQVRATRRGSFQVDIQTVQSLIDSAVDLLSGRHVTAILALAGLLGIGRLAGCGLIELIRRLRGKQPKAVRDIGDQKVTIELEDGSSFEVKGEVWSFYQNVRIRRAAYSVVRPLDGEGVETVEFIEEEVVVSKVAKAEVRYFEVAQADTLQVTESERTTYLRIEGLWFREGNKWRFSEGDGATFAASVVDNRFLERVLKSDEPFRPSDILQVRLRQTQYPSDKGMKTEYEILEVLQHVHGPKQIPLDLSNTEADKTEGRPDI